MTRRAHKRDLVGRTIVAVDFRRHFDGTSRSTHPLITLDNGARLYFWGQETDNDDYGVGIGIIKKAKT